MPPCEVALGFGLVEDEVPTGFCVEVTKGVDRNEQKGHGAENCDSSSVPRDMR